MSLRVSISLRAEADLTRQYRWYYKKAGLAVAERFLAAFDASVARLAGQPGLGRLRKFREPELAGIRSFPVGGRFAIHIIWHRNESGELRIERVVHGARDLPSRLLGPPED